MSYLFTLLYSLKKDGEPKLFDISIDAIFSQLFFETKTLIIFQTHIHKFEKIFIRTILIRAAC